MKDLSKYMLSIILSSAIVGCGAISDEVGIDSLGDSLDQVLNGGFSNTLRANAGRTTPEEIRETYKYEYQTSSKKSEKITATGLIALPLNAPNRDDSSEGLSLLLNLYELYFYNKSDGFDIEGVPSEIVFTTENEIKNYDYLKPFFDTKKYFVLMPDYVGLPSGGLEIHPYLIKDSLAQASVDMLRSVVAYCEEKNIKLNGKLYITGLGEGGYAALATVQELEKNEHIKNLKIMAVAPISAPLDLVKLSTEIDKNSKVFVDILDAYTDYYGVAKDSQLKENSLDKFRANTKTRYFQCIDDNTVKSSSTAPAFDYSHAIRTDCSENAFKEVSKYFSQLE